LEEIKVAVQKYQLQISQFKALKTFISALELNAKINFLVLYVTASSNSWSL